MSQTENKIKKLREDRGLSIRAFATLCGVCTCTVVNYERDGAESRKVAQRIADKLGVDISEVM